MGSSEKFCLKWNDFQENISTTFRNMRDNTDFANVTLACEDGHQVEAHKIILAVSSPFFQNLLQRNKHTHPLIYMRKMKSEDLVAIVNFLYHGEVNIYQENLDSFLAIADELELKGLTGTTRQPRTEEKYIQYHQERKELENEMFEDKADIATNIVEIFESFDTFEVIVETPVATTKPMDTKASVDLHKLDEMIKSMMSFETRSAGGNHGNTRLCKVCGKAGGFITIMNHIEAKHIDGVFHSCNSCDKTFRSRNILNAQAMNINSIWVQVYSLHMK